MSALSKRESSALWELNWVHVTGTAPEMQVVLPYVPVTGDWTLVLHGHLNRATGKASAPHNLHASETHLLICALQVLVHHLLPFVPCRVCRSAVTFICAQHLSNGMSRAVQAVTEWERHSDTPNPF